MTYTDFGEFKKQVKNIMPGFIFFVGIVLSFSCVVTIIIGIPGYKEEISQLNWIKTEATVTNVYERMTTNGNKYIIYDILYEYSAEENVYTGLIESVNYKKIGDEFEIKYNPQSPKKSTSVLKPNVNFIIFGVILGISGILLMILPFIFKKNFHKNKS